MCTPALCLSINLSAQQQNKKGLIFPPTLPMRKPTNNETMTLFSQQPT